MSFSYLTHIFTTLTTPQTPHPKPNHTGLLHRASLPTNTPSTFPAAPNAPTTAFAPYLVSGASYRESIASLLRPRALEDDAVTTAEAEEENRGGDGTSWVLSDTGVDAWDVGWEKATQMVVKRKGRGVFRFERAMMEGWSVGLSEEVYEGMGREEVDGDGKGGVVDRVGKLQDGFEYREWVDEEMAAVSGGGSAGKDEDKDDVMSRDGLNGRRDSVRYDMYPEVPR